MDSNTKNRKLNRFKDYDYSCNGAYFVTICTKDKEDYFGKCCNAEIRLNAIGKLAKKYWREIPNHYESILIDEFIVMPNHIHGIMLIGSDNYILRSGKSSIFGQLSKIVKSFKEIVTKTVRIQFADSEFAWQRSFMIM